MCGGFNLLVLVCRKAHEKVLQDLDEPYSRWTELLSTILSFCPPSASPDEQQEQKTVNKRESWRHDLVLELLQDDCVWLRVSSTAFIFI